METRNHPRQPAQPPKQAAYDQASNPVSHNLQEQRAPESATRHHGDAPVAITRGANSKPSSEEARTRLTEQRRLEQERMHNSPDVDVEYGVEQQPAEGYIADAVERKGMGMRRAQAGAHAGPVGSAGGPGHPGFGEQSDLAAHMDEKREVHDRMLGEKVGHSPSEYDVADREAARHRKLKQNEDLDVTGAVKEASGDPVVTNE
ncbi:uncharacterized protein N7484_010342 [Penicillium longicatenatum]|uniref:uncharacterized protein n=1 Tax=Penicillium longicatenatum TaxID=1561947 RepID=UPI002549329D|nr:uncharacterized protein N7484_010342 [Penicillium longicatenatum]KAJ5630242.1 hypothetical protein N7484_010342 [Penicillium longicatenatum]